MNYVTSPFFFGHCEFNDSIAIELLSGNSYKKMTLLAFEIIHFFREPTTIEASQKYGFKKTDILESIDSGLIISVDSMEYKDSSLWSERNWQRSAYLLFSQQNLNYLDIKDDDSTLEKLSDTRNEYLEEYLNEGSYRDHNWMFTGENEVQLDIDDEFEISLDSLIKRRSKRQFSFGKVSLKQLSTVLYYSTKQIRDTEASRNNDEPFYLLNSYFSWLKVYVVVQGVDNLSSGVYQYNPLSNSLYLIHENVEDSKISSCLHHQEWISGSGFCLFLVADWERYMWLYRQSRAYINLLIQAGEFGQEVLNASYSLGLVGWMTPAIEESKASDFLKLRDNQEEAIYFLKLGMGLN